MMLLSSMAQSQSWTQIGTDLYGDGYRDMYGWSLNLSADGNTLAVGAAQNGAAEWSSGYSP